MTPEERARRAEKWALVIPAPCLCTDTPLCKQHKVAAEVIRKAVDIAVAAALAPPAATWMPIDFDYEVDCAMLEYGGQIDAGLSRTIARRLRDTLRVPAPEAPPPPFRRPAMTVECKARQSTADPSQDCNWPFCACDPLAIRVIDTLLECGWRPPERREASEGPHWKRGYRAADGKMIEVEEALVTREQWAGRYSSLESNRMAQQERAEQAEAERDAARREASELRVALQKVRWLMRQHWSNNPNWRAGNEHIWTGQADVVAEAALAAPPPPDPK
jgi:hypothetical protein